MQLVVIFGALAVAYVASQNAPFIEPCFMADKACLMRSAQTAVSAVAHGVPALGMAPLDPLLVEHVDASTAGLSLDFYHTQVRGLRNCHVADIGRTSRHDTFVTLKCQVQLTGDYRLGGKLLLLPIEGEGRYKIRLREIKVRVDMQVGERDSNGELYWTVKNWHHQADAIQPVHYDFQNLFHGNKEMAKSVHQVANENWHQIFREVAPPIVKSIVSHVVTEIAKLFERVPIRQLALD